MNLAKIFMILIARGGAVDLTGVLLLGGNHDATQLSFSGCNTRITAVEPS